MSSVVFEAMKTLFEYLSLLATRIIELVPSTSNARAIVVLGRTGMVRFPELSFMNTQRKRWGVVRPCTERADGQHGLVSSDGNGEFLN
jgi:hypothetical protein